MKVIHLQAEMARRSLPYFCELVWRYVEPGKPFRKSWWFLQLCHVLEKCERGEILRLLLLVAPRHGKSTLVRVLYPAWIQLRRGGKARFIGVTYSSTLTERDSRRLRDLCNTPIYKQLVAALPIPDWKVRTDANRLDHWYTTSAGAVHSYGLTAATGEGADFILVDDLLSVEIANSKKERENAIRFYQETLHSRLDNNPDPGVKIIINQITNENDVTGHIINELGNREGYEMVCLPARYEKPEDQKYVTSPKTGFKDERKKVGEILCPELTSDEFLKETEDISPYIYAAHYQQNPVPRGGGIIQKAWWREISRQEVAELRRGDVIASYDLNFGKEINKQDDGSYNARVSMQVFYMKVKGGYETKVFLMGGTKRRCGFKDWMTEMMNYDKAVKPNVTIVEDKAMGPAMLSAVGNRIKNIHSFNPDRIGSKNVRMETISLLIDGNFYYDPTHKPSVEVLDSICKFPFGAEDDIPDAFSCACIWLQKTRTIRLPEERDYIQRRIIGDRKVENIYDPESGIFTKMGS